jgi:transposase
MVSIGYLYDIRSERQLEQDVKTNVAYRWFFGLKLTDRVPDHTTSSLHWCTRCSGSSIFQEIFDEFGLQGTKHRIISGRVLMTDSTHIKANANKRRFIKKPVAEQTKSYLNELDEAILADRTVHRKRP